MLRISGEFAVEGGAPKSELLGRLGGSHACVGQFERGCQLVGVERIGRKVLAAKGDSVSGGANRKPGIDTADVNARADFDQEPHAESTGKICDVLTYASSGGVPPPPSESTSVRRASQTCAWSR